MIRRLFYFIAGVDHRTMATCPATDRMWAAHLGFSLCLSFTVVLGVSYYATGYMISDVWVRLGVATVVALTVFMFDRAICQSDWFYQGMLWNNGGTARTGAEVRQSAWRFSRITIRLAMSLGLAWVIATFMELAIFSGTISDKIERDRIASNQPIFQKVERYETELNGEIERQRASLAELEALLRNALAEAPAPDSATPVRADDIDQQIKALGVREEELRAAQRQIEESIRRYTADMNAEETGEKASPTNTGRRGPGPRYEFAKRQKEFYEAQLLPRANEIAQVEARRDELRSAVLTLSANALAQRDLERSLIQGKRDELKLRVDAARAELKQSQMIQEVRADEFRRKALNESYFQDRKDVNDPLSRIAAYQELKNDPKDGATITLFSWMTRFFIIFLEIVPVVAKIFFSPPSVYAAKIQAEVKRERSGVRGTENQSGAEWQSKTEPRPEPSTAKTGLEPFAKYTDAPDQFGAERRKDLAEAKRQIQDAALATRQGAKAEGAEGPTDRIGMAEAKSE